MASSSFSVSIVIPVWNEWQFTKGCLENLRATLGPRDEVIIVDNGSEDSTPRGLRHFSWAKVITNETNRGFAIACNQGAAAAKNDIVVFLNNDTITPPHWLDSLIAPFADESVAATGPRSNYVSGPQIVEGVDYQLGDSSAMRRFAKKWQNDNKGLTTEFQRLVGFCLAVRRTAFEAINGFDEGFEIGGGEDDDLGLRLIQNGGRMLICHGSFVHHHGHATFDGNGLDWYAIQNENLDRFRAKHSGALNEGPRTETFLSACMIVKDEVSILEKTLSSLNGLVDEVIIYDTGSTDGTIELARAAGAHVIEGYWDEDFGRARNEALKACGGEWILWIDADEVFEGDSKAFRSMIATTNATALHLTIRNLSADGNSDYHHRPIRVFRRATFHWAGRLHEQVVTRSKNVTPIVATAEHGILVHSGYLPESVAAKGKMERNIRMAELEIDESDGRDPVDKIVNLARSYMFAERYEEGLALVQQARSLHTDLAPVRRMIMRTGAQICANLERPEEILEWADGLAKASTIQDTARYLRGTALVQLGRNVEALELLSDLKSITDDDGVLAPMSPVYLARLAAHAALGQWEEACSEIEPAVLEGSAHLLPWDTCAEAYHRTDRPMASLVALVPDTQVALAASRVASVSPEAADRFLEELARIGHVEPTVVASAIRVSAQLSIERALEWSNRFRNSGIAEHCPLVVIARDQFRDALDRISAAAIIKVAFDDSTALGSFELVARSCPVGQLESVILRLNDIAPELLESFILAASTGGRRSFALAQILHGLGAEDEGIAVLLHGVETDGGRDIVAKATEWLASIGRDDIAQQVRETAAK